MTYYSMIDTRNSSNETICGVIPARYGSTRFPAKLLARIKDKPLIQYVYERAACAKSLAMIIVATDDKRIFETATEFGAKAVMTSSDHPSGTDRIAEAVRDIECRWVINIQGDEPLIDPHLIDRLCLTLKQHENADMVTAVSAISDKKIADNPNIVKAVVDKNGRALYFSRSPIPYYRDADGARQWLRHIGIYGYRKSFLQQFITYGSSHLEQAEKLEQLRALEYGHSIYTVLTDYCGIGVDTPEDLEEVEKLL